MPDRSPVAPANGGPGIAVFAPLPVLTVTVETTAAGEDEIHLHAGGQGFWVGRMAAALGAEVTLCSALGGESGSVLAGLIVDKGLHLRTVQAARPSGSYIHDRRSGERSPVAYVRSPALERHELDHLYGAMTAASLSSDVAVLTGAEDEDLVPPSLYRRLAGDLRRNGTPVVADLTGTALEGALVGGVDVLKLSHEELGELAEGPLDSLPRFAVEIARLQRRGAECVLISRAEQPALARIDRSLLELSGPRFEPLDPQGAGDSMVAALAVGIGRGSSLPDVLRLAVAAGALNVTRHGLGSGRREDVELLAGSVAVRELPDSGRSADDSAQRAVG